MTGDYFEVLLFPTVQIADAISHVRNRRKLALFQFNKARLEVPPVAGPIQVICTGIRFCISLYLQFCSTRLRSCVYPPGFPVYDHNKWKDLVFIIRKTRPSSIKPSLVTAAAVIRT